MNNKGHSKWIQCMKRNILFIAAVGHGHKDTGTQGHWDIGTLEYREPRSLRTVMMRIVNWINYFVSGTIHLDARSLGIAIYSQPIEWTEVSRPWEPLVQKRVTLSHWSHRNQSISTERRMRGSVPNHSLQAMEWDQSNSIDRTLQSDTDDILIHRSLLPYHLLSSIPPWFSLWLDHPCFILMTFI